MTSIISYAVSGMVFGLSGGLSPGPLLTLVISETLKHGVREGIKVSISPLLTDLPIIFLTTCILSRLSNIQPLLCVIYMTGCAFLVYLGYESISFKGVDIDIVQVKAQSFQKGIITNFLNPSPYIFWLSIGAPILLDALKVSIFAVSIFIFIFYTFLVGSKILLAVIIGRMRHFLKSIHYIYTLRFLGIILFLFAILFFKEGLKCFFAI